MTVGTCVAVPRGGIDRVGARHGFHESRRRGVHSTDQGNTCDMDGRTDMQLRLTQKPLD